MGEPAAADGDAPDSSATGAKDGTSGSHGSHGLNPRVINVDAHGDVVLDVTFETSPDTLRKSRKAALAAARKAGSTASTTATAPELKPKVRIAYRVSLHALRQHSKYFANLLFNPQFREAKVIADAHQLITERGAKPAESEPSELPWLPIADDDDATRTAGREHAFEDMLRLIHGKPPKVARAGISYVTTMAIIADRFDCTSAIGRCLNSELKFKWPITSGRPLRDESGRETEVEQVLRQKILVSWLLNQPMRLHSATRELIIRGSSHWSTFYDGESENTAAWWNLPDGLEHELQYRRECIMNTISSVQRHFLRLYTSRERQCKLGYDSSAACDSFQLGQLLKFLVSKELLFLVDFSPVSLDSVPDTTILDTDELLATLRQLPSYQVDKYHTNCGPRIRVDPVLEYIKSMLSANVISIPLADWKKRRTDVSWVVTQTTGDGIDGNGGLGTFQFTRALANDQRLKFEGAIYADKMAKRLFTAEAWDWTPEW